MAQQIKKKFIADDAVDGAKILLEDGQSLRAYDGITEVDLIKIAVGEVFINGEKLLESSGLISAAKLPSYVDDVIEAANFAALPETGESGKIYVTLDTNKQYRWSGSAYVQITSGAVDSVNGQTGLVVLESDDINLSASINGETTVQGSLVDLDDRIDALEVGGGDTKQVKISANDTTEGYIEDKIVGASGKISISTLNDAGDEDLQISIGSDVFDKTVDDTDDINEGASNLFFTDARAKSAAVADSITDGITDVAPSQNAVSDALALKANSNLDNLAASINSNGYLLYSDVTFSKGAGVNVVLRGKPYVPGEASGNLSMFSGSTQNANTGGIFLNSGNIIAGATSGDSGQALFRSGSVGSGSGNSGTAQVLSGTTIDGTSGFVALGSGNSSAGASGDVYIFAGLASTTRGKIELDASQAEFLNTKIVFTGSAQKIENLADGTLGTDAVNKNQLDTKVSKSGDTLTGILDMGSNRITSVADPIANQDAATKKYVDDADALKLSLSGGTMSGNIAMGSNSITGLADPTAAQDAATKAYVDSVAEGLKPKQAVRVATTANIVLAPAPASIDGVTLVNGDRVLVKDQTTSSENGIYVFDGTDLVRASDFDSASNPDEINGSYTFAQDGTENAGKGYVQQGSVSVVGSDPIIFVHFNSIADLVEGDAIVISGNIISVDADQLDGEGLEVDGSNHLRIAASAAGDGLSGGSGSALSVNVDNSSIEIVADSLQIKDLGVSTAKIADSAVTEAKLATDSVSTDKLQSVSVTEAKIANAAVTEDKIADSAVATAKIADDAVTAAKINSDVAGDGLEQDLGGALKIQPEFSVVPDISVGASGLSIANRWGKEFYTIVSADTVLTSNYYDLSEEIEDNSLVAFVDRLAIHEGQDYSISTVSGVTRVTFLNDLVNPGPEKLAANDVLNFTYQKKAK